MSDTQGNHSTGRLFVELADEDLEFTPLAVPDRTPTARQILAYRNLSPHEEYVVLQWLASGEIEDRRLEELIVFEGDSPPRLIIARADRTFRLSLDDHSLVWPRNVILETALRKLGNVPESAHIYLARDDEPDRLIGPGERLRLGPEGVETLYSRASVWKLNVQGVVIESDEPTIIAREAIRRAGFDPDAGWIIVLKTSQGRHQVGIDDPIDLRLPGIEKLRLTPREINNGEVATLSQRDFALLAVDEAGLAERGMEWEAIVDGGRRWLLLYDYPLPAGYNVVRVTIAVEVPTSYNSAELDMFYCHPHLTKVSGGQIPQTQVHEMIRGISYQRWSRHRGAGSRWRPGRDNVLSHLALIDEAIRREVEG